MNLPSLGYVSAAFRTKLNSIENYENSFPRSLVTVKENNISVCTARVISVISRNRSGIEKFVELPHFLKQ